MNTDDRRLITESLSGRTDSFGQLVLRYQDRLYHAVLKVVNHPDDAHDVVQDAFLNAYQSLASFKGDSEFYTWLYRIAFNAGISQRRRQKSFVSLDTGRNGLPVADPQDLSEGVRPGEMLERTEEEQGLYHALSRLSQEHREVLVHKDLEGLKYEQIAAILEVPIGTVRSRLHRARLELQSLLETGQPSDSHRTTPRKDEVPTNFQTRR